MNGAVELASEAFDALPMQAAILDADGEIQYTNHAWKGFAEANGLVDGFATEQVNYLDICDASDGENAATAARGIRAVLAGDQEGFAFEYPCHRPDEKRWFTMRASRFRHQGEPFVFVLHLNITERKRTERRVESTAARLRDVARLLSHDIRNPLAVATGYAEMLASDGDDDRVERVVDALERMEHIVTDALVLARDNDADVRIVDLRSQAEQAWSNVDTVDATLTVPETFEFYADPTLLLHVFENLFRNAVEHAGDGVAVTVAPLWAGTDRLGFYVADDGPGISDDGLARVFDVGYTTADSGTGLGLSIVEQIADAHEWIPEATTSADGGARFEMGGVEVAE